MKYMPCKSSTQFFLFYRSLVRLELDPARLETRHVKSMENCWNIELKFAENSLIIGGWAKLYLRNGHRSSRKHSTFSVVEELCKERLGGSYKVMWHKVVQQWMKLMQIALLAKQGYQRWLSIDFGSATKKKKKNCLEVSYFFHA